MDRTKFFKSVRQTLFNGVMTSDQVSGIEAKLNAWEKIAPTADLRHPAYSLATSYHETDKKMQPLREYGRGKGRRYGVKAGPFKQVYYGRGDVQLTWLANYERATRELLALGVLKSTESLVRTPDLALRPDVSAAIMIVGMTEGWFTGRKLADYFAGNRSDWVDARRIINGTDKAALIAGYGLHFYAALQDAAIAPRRAA